MPEDPMLREIRELREAFEIWYNKLYEAQETPGLRRVLERSEKSLWNGWLRIKPVWTSKDLDGAKKYAKKLKQNLFTGKIQTNPPFAQDVTYPIEKELLPIPVRGILGE